jgi:hypothetical protein
MVRLALRSGKDTPLFNFTTGRQIELVYVVEVNDCIAMHAQKTAWVKDGLKVLHTLPKQVRLFPQVRSNVLPQ